MNQHIRILKDLIFTVVIHKIMTTDDDFEYGTCWYSITDKKTTYEKEEPVRIRWYKNGKFE